MAKDPYELDHVEVDRLIAMLDRQRLAETPYSLGTPSKRWMTSYVEANADPDADTAPISIRDGDTLKVNLGRVPKGATPTPWGYEDQLERFCYIRIPRNRYIKVITSTVVKHGSPADLLTLIGLMGDDVAWFDESGTPIQSLEVR